MFWLVVCLVSKFLQILGLQPWICKPFSLITTSMFSHCIYEKFSNQIIIDFTWTLFTQVENKKERFNWYFKNNKILLILWYALIECWKLLSAHPKNQTVHAYKVEKNSSNRIPILGFEIIKQWGDFNFSIAYSRATSICWEVESVNDH